MKDEETNEIELKETYIIIPAKKEEGCKECDLFGKRCDKLLDEGKRPSCVFPRNIVFKIKRHFPDGNKKIIIKLIKKDKEDENKENKEKKDGK